ncbi:MAG: hypothetical protein AAFQ67_08160, partial [Pseudomonadota bacterium]
MGGAIIEIVIVLVSIFIAMAALVSALQGLINQVFRMKATNLRRGIKRLLHDETYGDQISDRFFRHPTIESLLGGRANLRKLNGDAFSLAVATAVQPRNSTGDAILALPSSAAALRDGELKKRLQAILPNPGEPGIDRDTILRSMSAWSESSNEKIKERYRSDSKLLSYIVAIAVTLLLNVNPIAISKYLLDNDNVRSSFAAAAPSFAAQFSATAEADPISLLNASGEDQVGLSATADAAGLMSAVFHCVQGELDFPIGWPWMDNFATGAKGQRAALLLGIPTAEDSCKSAYKEASTTADPELRTALQNLKLADGERSNVEVRPANQQTTLRPIAVILGWIIM